MPVNVSDSEPAAFSGRIWRGGRFVRTEFSISGGKIAGPAQGPPIRTAYIIPPFADPHVHGGWGTSFREGGFFELESRLVEQGVQFAIPTLENLPHAELRRTAAAFRAYRAEHPDSIFPFLRVEGPFISPEKKGFQREEFIQEVTEDNIRDLFSVSEIGVVTFAPEIPGAEQLARRILASGRFASIGHSRADFRTLLRVYNLGIRHMTHYPNAMSGLHHREIGLLGAGLLLDDIRLELIADGIHIADDFFDLVLKTRGPTIALTSDLIPPAFSTGARFDGRVLKRRGRRLTLPDGTLAGGATSVPDQVRRLRRRGVAAEDLVRIACLNTRGWFNRPVPELATGAPADFCCLDEDMNVTAVYRGGRTVPEEKT